MSNLNPDGLTALLALCRNDRISEVAQAIRDSEWLKDHDASVRRDAQADAWDECVRRVADMPISGTGYARIIRWAMPTNPYRAAAIRRGEGEEN